jgi:hypothetical protein
MKTKEEYIAGQVEFFENCIRSVLEKNDKNEKNNQILIETLTNKIERVKNISDEKFKEEIEDREYFDTDDFLIESGIEMKGEDEITIEDVEQLKIKVKELNLLNDEKFERYFIKKTADVECLCEYRATFSKFGLTLKDVDNMSFDELDEILSKK